MASGTATKYCSFGQLLACCHSPSAFPRFKLYMNVFASRIRKHVHPLHCTAQVAAAAVILALQPLVSRETSPASGGAVVTVSRINTGPGASNVIPDSVALQVGGGGSCLGSSNGV